MLKTILVAGILFSTSAQSHYFSYKSWLASSKEDRAAYIAGAFDSFVFYYDTDEGHDTNEHFRACVDRLHFSPQRFSEELFSFGANQTHMHGTVQALIVDYLFSICGRYKATGNSDPKLIS